MSFWFYGREGGTGRGEYAADLSILSFVLFIVILVLTIFAFAPRLF
jgi:hypothetical protein